MNTNELREKYLEFFTSKGHRRCPSDVLVPTWDPSVLFTPAGMNQFKDHFLGKVRLDFVRATSCQKCLRTGDIENVGRTAYHHTFFEMLGNFSFGDYFKQDAIAWAWEFLTDKKWLAIDPKRLSVSVYKDDDEAAEIWHETVGLPSSLIERLDEDENFWPAKAPSEGPDGVCGPCSEIFYHNDRGQSVEIWNLVFTQFNRVGDPPDNLRPLPSKNIDTGMGLERAAAALQGVDTNFHIDTLLPIVQATADVCDTKYDGTSDQSRRIRRITDHMRACTMAVHENVYPGPQKEKYVIRRLLRRAVLDGHQLGRREPFLHKVVPAVVEMMKVPYPELASTVERVSDVIKSEESSFFETIDAGLARVERIFESMRDANQATVDGAEAADLYQTFGVPPELFETMAADTGLAFDWKGFHQAMQRHGDASGRAVHTVMGSHGPIDQIKKALPQTEFLGYDATEADAQVKFIVADNHLRDEVSSMVDESLIVLDRSPFYGESGGQVGDSGRIVGPDGEFEVTDTQKDGDLILHYGKVVRGVLRAGTMVKARVNEVRRDAIRRAHSATHLLHHALQKHIGSHAQQQGSKVDGDWLRFDFTNLKAITDDTLVAIERDVNQRVADASPIAWETVPLATAREAGAMMLFGEKYPDPVRMVTMGDFSRELCGGTHLTNTSDVGPFELISEESVSAGVRRVVALTGESAERHRQETHQIISAAAEKLKVAPAELSNAVKQLVRSIRGLKKQSSGGDRKPLSSDAKEKGSGDSENQELTGEQEKSILLEAARTLNVSLKNVPERLDSLLREQDTLTKQLETRAAAGSLSSDDLLGNAKVVEGVHVIVAEAPGADAGTMRQLIDQLRKKSSPCAVLLASCESDDKVTLVAGVSRDVIPRGMNAGTWAREVAAVVGGGGGGRPDMAQAGGKHPEKLNDAFEKAHAFVHQTLA